MRLILFLLLLLLTSACHGHVQAPSSTPCERYVHYIFHADREFTVSEAIAIRQAALDWYKYTNGRVDFLVAFDLDYRVHSDEPQIVRTVSTSVVVQSQESEYAKAFKVDSYPVMGWARSEPPRLFLVVDRVDSTELMRALAAHEMGHAAEMRWRNCSYPKDCNHATDSSALMAAQFSGKMFNEADRKLCREACLCP